MRTEELPTNIVELSDIRKERAVASSPFGPVRAGLTTLHTTEEGVQLTELLNSLERKVANLQSKFYTDSVISLTAIQVLLAELCNSIIEEASTEDI